MSLIHLVCACQEGAIYHCVDHHQRKAPLGKQSTLLGKDAINIQIYDAMHMVINI